MERGKGNENDSLTTECISPSNVTSQNRLVGPYKLLQQIGEGGMGTVWMAEQEKPVRRRVALKLIKESIGQKEVLARFEAERQALAMMDHQNIAKVLDAGSTDGGRPYFVMELIMGVQDWYAATFHWAWAAKGDRDNEEYQNRLRSAYLRLAESLSIDAQSIKRNLPLVLREFPDLLRGEQLAAAL